MGIIQRIKNTIKAIAKPEEYIKDLDAEDEAKTLVKIAEARAKAGETEDKSFLDAVKKYQEAGYDLRTAVEKAEEAEDLGKLKGGVKRINFVCPRCRQKFSSKNEFENHWFTDHSFEKGYETVRGKVREMIPTTVKEKTPTFVKEVAKETIKTGEKASFGAWRGAAGKMLSAGGLVKRGAKGAGSSVKSLKKVRLAETDKWEMIKCSECGTVYPVTEEHCPNPECVTPNPHYRKAKALRGAAGKTVKANLYEAFILIIGAMSCFVIPPIFGLPSFSNLAVGLVFAAAYVMFPSEHHVLASLEHGEDLGAKSGILVAKSALKLGAMIFIILQFWIIYRIAALILGFFFYFSMPLRYKTNRPWKMIEAWIRMGLGAYLAWVFWLTFGAGSPIAYSLLWMGLAFFATLPVQIEAETEPGEYKVKIELKGLSKSEKTGLEAFERILFLILMLAGFFSFSIPYGGLIPNFEDVNVLMFFTMWGLALFVGLTAGPEARPPIGVIVILIAMFVFAGTYTGFVGQAIFGPWWGQVYGFAQTYITPLSDAWTQARSAMSESWMIITNPMQYYAIQDEKRRAAATIVKTGGSTASIEITRFDFDTTILDPYAVPLLGSIDIENKGEFKADGLVVNVSAYWTNLTSLLDEAVGTFGTITCSGADAVEDPRRYFATCNWSRIIYPAETKTANFKIDDTAASWTTSGGIDLSDYNRTTPYYYFHGGDTVKINLRTTYNYNVNVSIPIQIINRDKYQTKVQAGDIMLATIQSQYSGGPVKATVSTQRQPIRTGEESLITLYIYNEGAGNITDVNLFTIYVPQILNPSTIESSTFTNAACEEGDSWSGPTDGMYSITCSYHWSPSDIAMYPMITSGKYKKVTFFVNPTYPSEITDERTVSIIGVANYRFTKTQDRMLQIAVSPYG